MDVKEGDKYDVLEKIGQGSFGVIRRVRRKDTGQILCRKEISYTRMTDKEKAQLYAELKILESLKHPNIVQYCHREHIKSSNDLHLYMEYCGNGDLGGYIKKLKEGNKYAEEDFVWTIFAQLVSALYRCHYGEDPPRSGEEGLVKKAKAFQTKEGHRVILHRDVKPDNVFLTQNNVVKLGDFGLSKIITAHDFASTYVGTPYYMSPEICASERYSHHSDVWSLGCIIYELATRCVPFDARNHVELVMKIKTGRYKPLPTTYSQDLTNIISWCLKIDPRSRPDMAQLLNVTQIKLARTRWEQSTALDIANGNLLRAQQERDACFIKLQASQKHVQDLKDEVVQLKEAGKKIEMECYARATLAIDQRVSEGLQELTANMNQQLAALRQEDEAKFKQRVQKGVQEELERHHALRPTSHGTSQTSDASLPVRAVNPLSRKDAGSFVTDLTADSSFSTDASSSFHTEPLGSSLSSVHIVRGESDDFLAPLEQDLKPKKTLRQPLGRAKTLANCNLAIDSLKTPVDVQMADPSPLVSHIKGLSLSPRRNLQNKTSSGLRGRNIFGLAAEQRLRPAVGDEISAFADDEFLEELDELESPSRPSIGLPFNTSSGGDPFKDIPTSKLAPIKRPRPSLGRQLTLPANTQLTAGLHQRAKSSNFLPQQSSTKSDKENRPCAGDINDVPMLNASPKRTALAKDNHAIGDRSSSPLRVKGRTLIELQQRQDPSQSDPEIGCKTMGIRKVMASPAKWDMDEDMPSPFLVRRGRMLVQ